MADWGGDEPIKAGDSLPITLTDGAGTLNLWANMVREGAVASDAVTSGDYSGAVTLTLTSQ